MGETHVQTAPWEGSAQHGETTYLLEAPTGEKRQSQVSRARYDTVAL
jgi:hypothetical protein